MSEIKWLVALYTATIFSGCSSHRASVEWPEPRPLGREFATRASPSAPFEADQGDRGSSSRAETQKPAPAAVSSDGEGGRPPSGPAPSPDRPKTISLRKAMALALLDNPTFQASSWEVRAADARRLQESLWPNPEIEAEVEEFAGDNSGFRDSETSVVLSQAILLGGKLAKRTRVAKLERDVAGWEYETQRLDVLTEVAKAFVAVLGSQRKVELAKETVRIAEGASAAAADRVASGAASPVEQTRAQVALAGARNELLQATQQLRMARIRLASTWGSADPRFTRAEGDLDVDLALPKLGFLARRMSQNPEMMRAAVAHTQRQAALELAKSKRVPDLTVRAGYKRVEAENANSFIAGLSLPLPIFDRNQGGIREARANLRKSKWEQQATEVQVRSALATAHSALAAAVEQRRAFKDEILPGAESAFEAIREGYRQGTFDYLDFLTAQQSLADTRMQHADVLVSLHEAAADVERLIGEPLPEATPSRQPPKENE